MKSQNVSNDSQAGSASEKIREEEMQEHPVMAIKPKTDEDENPHELNTEETNDEDAEDFADTMEKEEDSEDEEEPESDEDESEDNEF